MVHEGAFIPMVYMMVRYGIFDPGYFYGTNNPLVHYMVHEGALYQWDKYPRLSHTITLLNKLCTRQIPLLVTWVVG